MRPGIALLAIAGLLALPGAASAGVTTQHASYEVVKASCEPPTGGWTPGGPAG